MSCGQAIESFAVQKVVNFLLAKFCGLGSMICHPWVLPVAQHLLNMCSPVIHWKGSPLAGGVRTAVEGLGNNAWDRLLLFTNAVGGGGTVGERERAVLSRARPMERGGWLYLPPSYTSLVFAVHFRSVKTTLAMHHKPNMSLFM